jgi:hypothetical protein
MTTSASSSNLTVPNSGWYDLFINRRQELITSCEQTVIQLQRVAAQWKEHIPAISVFANSISHKLQLLQQNHPGHNTPSPWGQFFDELKTCIGDINSFIDILSNKKNTTPQIITAFIERIRNWPQLIKTFNNLELDLIAGGVFSSFSSQIHYMEEKASSLSLKNILPPYHFQQLEESIRWIEKNMDESFAGYPETVQDTMLIAASELNSVFCHAYLIADKFASQIDFDLEKLVQEPLFTMKDTDSKSDEQTVSFHQLALRFRDLYAKCIEKANYTLHEEYYPYQHSVLKQRLTFPQALAEQEIAEHEKNIQYWQKVKKECEDIIEAKIRELTEEHEANLIFSKQTSIDALQALKNDLPDTQKDIEHRIQEHVQHAKKKDVAKTLNQVRAAYNNAADRRTNRLAWFEKQKRNIHELITAAEQKATSTTLHAMPYPAIMSKIMETDAPRLIDHTKSLISILMQPDGSDSKETMFDIVLSTLQQCQIKLKEMLDSAIYSDWFEKGDYHVVNVNVSPLSNRTEEKVNYEEKYENTPIKGDLVKTSIEIDHSAKFSWLLHVAELMRKIKKLASDAKKMHTKSTQKSKMALAPSEHFQTTVQQLNATIVLLTATVKSYNEFRHHPVIQALPPIGIIFANAIPRIQSEVQTALVAPLSNHPLQIAWNEKDEYASPNDKLKGGLQQLKRVFLSLLHQSDTDPSMKINAQNGLSQGDELLDAYQQTKSMPEFILKHPRQIYRFIKLLSDSFTILLKLAGDEALLAAKQMNDALRQLFVLFDKLEMRFYLKENYFTNLISVNNQSLLEIVKLFSDTLKEQGFVFNSEECFPYEQAILTQRKALFAEHHDSDNRTKQFIQERIIMAENNIKSYQAQDDIALDEQKNAYKENVLEKLKDRRNELISKYQSSCRPSTIKIKKIILLDRLMKEISKSNSIGIRLDYFTVAECKLLWDGRTGQLLKTLLCCTKDHVTLQLQTQKSTLKRQQTSCGLFSSRDTTRQKIAALEALEYWLLLPGFRVEDAMNELKAHDFASHQILEKYQKELIHPLKELDSHIPDFLIGKKVIGLTGKPVSEESFIVDENEVSQSLSLASLRQPLLANRLA